MSGPGQTLFAFVRHWSRRTNPGDTGRDVLVTEAVRTLSARGGATINAVAYEIGIDQSGASRLVRAAVTAGYLAMTRAAADARRREVTVTPAGEALLADAHRWQEQVFDELTASWPAHRRAEFHQAMRSLLETSHAR
jgi:DNA-binding MarR family transcriptional regulator